MNILHLEASSGWGGQEMRILKEAIGMRERGHRVIFAVMKQGLLIEKAQEAGFIVYSINFKKMGWLFALFQLFAIMKRFQIDIVNTHSSLDSWIGGIAARLFGKKLLRTRHLSTAVKKGVNSRLVYGFLADFVVTTCQSIIEPLAEQSQKPPSLFRSIATGVDPDQIESKRKDPSDFRKEFGLKSDEFLVGTACFMRSWKGIDDFLMAAKLLQDTLAIKWVIIGGGHAEKYQKLAKEWELNHVIFTGHLENPFPAMESLNAFALLSTAHEGVSQAILQAAYLKKPLIATSTGGLKEVCLDQRTGICVPPFSPQEVVKAVLQLKNNPLLAKHFGENARQLVMEKFTFSRTLEEMEEVYKNLIFCI